MDDRPRCGAKKKDGNPCGKWPMDGATRCRLHGGASPQARARAAERRQQAQVLKALGDVPVENVDPAEALLRLVSMKWAEVHWLRGKVLEVDENPRIPVDADGIEDDPDGLTWGRTKHVSGTDPETGGMADSTTYEAAPNVWWRLLREAEDQLAKYSTAALRAGVERRQIELQEAQALHLATAINRILDALNLSPEQAKLIPSVVPDVLRSLPISEGKS